MTDHEIVEAFEQGTLVPAAFTHREHVRVAWIYLTRHGRAAAEQRMLAGLRAFAARAGKPEKFDGPLTRAWVAAIAEATASCGATTFADLVRARPDLLDRASVHAAR
jgi:hypothetical protein